MFTLQWLIVLLSIVGDNHQQALYVHHPFATQKQSHCSCRRNRHNHSKEESQLNHQFGEHTGSVPLGKQHFPHRFLRDSWCEEDFLQRGPRQHNLHREIGEKRKHLRLAEIRYVCEEYGIAPQVVAMRAEQERIISHSAYQQLLRQKSELQSFVLPQEKPTRLEQMVQRALADGEINEARVAELLNQWQ